MTNRRSRTESPRPHELPHHRAILEGTDWASLATVCGTGGSLPTALARFIDPDPVVRTVAVDDALREVTHQNTIYEATVPVACYVAAVLHHPVVASGDSGTDAGTPPHRPAVVRLLEWLGDTAYDADDECVAISERHCGEGFLAEDRAMRAFRELRPALFSAVRPLLDHDDAQVREAAFVAAVPLAEHPALATHRAELAGHARRLLATSTDRHHRDRVLAAMKAWGHDTGGLENADDIAARERHARLKAERESWWAADGTGGYSDSPPF
ncbi:hypothetical protein [Streptomyces sp. NRRL S-37]|uniref:hypothetical protein n=1 Tax=Streptomyces sp. NRRL S-37 TaxID=1463903 RepID=UPI0004C700DF|nr:hypothetical protein [Streptomyces sp. NRRL S-37]